MAFEELAGMLKQIKEQEPVQRTSCPRCEYQLTKGKDGTLHCDFCGWTDAVHGRKLRG